MSDQKHLTLEGRIAIEKGLDNRLSFKAIALSVDKDCTTISKEVRNHLVYEKTGSYGCHKGRACRNEPGDQPPYTEQPVHLSHPDQPQR